MPPDGVGGGSANDPRDAAWVAAWVGAAWRRWRGWTLLHAVVSGAGAGLVLRAAGPVAAGVWVVVAAAALAVVVTLVSRRFRDVHGLLATVEAQQPELRNALIAWHEGHDHLSPAIAGRLARQARAGLDNAAWPRPYGRTAWLLAVGCVAVGLLAPALLTFRFPSPPARPGTTTSAAAGSERATAPLDWTATVDSPAYTRIPRVHLRRPTRLDVIAGARVHLTFTHWPSSARASIGTADLAVNVRSDEAAADFRAEASDVLMLRGSTGDVLQTIAIVVRPDAPPATRIVAPGADVRRDAAVGAIAIRITAQDDIGLRDLRLR
ncbi:MAG TPA: DUF4175 family protein, partial [Luteitalea sp.]|nr:DUF4175 family protein [Luteitalea sp.]